MKIYLYITLLILTQNLFSQSNLIGIEYTPVFAKIRELRNYDNNNTGGDYIAVEKRIDKIVNGRSIFYSRNFNPFMRMNLGIGLIDFTNSKTGFIYYLASNSKVPFNTVETNRVTSFKVGFDGSLLGSTYTKAQWLIGTSFDFYSNTKFNIIFNTTVQYNFSKAIVSITYHPYVNSKVFENGYYTPELLERYINANISLRAAYKF